MENLFLDYDKIAPEYNQRYPGQQPTLRGLALLDLARQLNAQQILEVGSGTGFWLNILSQTGRTMFGLDYSMGMLEQAKRQSASLKLARGTATGLPYRDRSFDLVYSVDALHHFGDQRTFVSEAFRVLKAGGVLAVIGFDPHAATTRWYIYDYFDHVYDNDLRRYPSRAAITGGMKAVGFENISTRSVEHVKNIHVGDAVLKDPYLKHNSTSQLALLDMDDYQKGVERIRTKLADSLKRNERSTFTADFLIDMHLGYKPLER